jgi:hypothetical protein
LPDAQRAFDDFASGHLRLPGTAVEEQDRHLDHAKATLARRKEIQWVDGQAQTQKARYVRLRHYGATL